MKNTVAVVLAGGEGKRFWPLTTDKNLFPLLGKTFFEHAVARTLPKEISRVVVVANEGNAQFFRSFKFSIPHDVVIQSSAQGMADALLSASSRLKEVSLFVIIADDLSEHAMLESVMNKAKSPDVFSVLPGWKAKRYFPGGYLIVDGDRITGIMEKPGEGNEPSPYVDLSVQYFRESDTLINALQQASSDRDDTYEQALTALMKKETFVMAPYEGPFVSLKYPWNVLDIMDMLFDRVEKKQGKNVEIRGNVVIDGNVILGDNVRIFESTKIVGPCYIGPNTIIGNNNLIRRSHIGANCVTGFNSEITRSYIGDNCWFHSNYVGDSVLEGDISMGSGNVFANLRLDEGEIISEVRGERINTKRTKLGAIIGKHVRIGVNTSIMPGIKIGPHTMIGAGLMVDRDIPEGSFVAGGTPMVITKNTHSIHGDRSSFKQKLS